MRMNRTALVASVCALISGAGVVCAQSDARQGPAASMIVTLEPKRGKQVPQLETADLEVTQARDKRPIQDFKPLRDSPVQLMLLIDNSSQSTFDVQINGVKKWIRSLPQNVQIGVAYMQNGMAVTAQGVTADHAAAANAIRVVMGIGGADVSPYDSLSDAIKKWPAAPEGTRREVLMISSGIEGLGGGIAPENPYVNRGISDAQRAGIPVYTIFNPASGHAGHSFWRTNYGQNFLSQVSDETGGEAYITTFSAPVSFDPFLADVLDKLNNQYLLVFSAKPSRKAELQPVKVRVKEKDVDVAAPDKVLVKAS